MAKTKHIFLIGLSGLLMAGCQSFGWDQDRSAERRKQALCGEVGTHDLPHCTSYRTGLQEDAIESIRQAENPPPTTEIIRERIRDRVERHNSDKD